MGNEKTSVSLLIENSKTSTSFPPRYLFKDVYDFLTAFKTNFPQKSKNPPLLLLKVALALLLLLLSSKRSHKKMAAEWTPPEPAIMGEEEFVEFRKDCLDDEGWVESLKNSKLVAMKKAIKGSSINLVKVKTQFKDIPPAVMYDIFHDHAYRKTWDLNMIDGHVIEMLSPNNEVGYYAASVCVFLMFLLFLLLFFRHCCPSFFFLFFFFFFSFCLFLFFLFLFFFLFLLFFFFFFFLIRHSLSPLFNNLSFFSFF